MLIKKVKPSFSERIWGGQGLKKFGYLIPENKKIGEAWVISAHDNGMGYIEEDNVSLKSFFNNNLNLFGNYDGEYPLLCKIITPEDYLSVQVHPSDEYALKHHNSLGKPESWYVIDCPDNAELIYGHNATSKEEFENLIATNQWDKLLKRIPIKKGDFVYVGAGKIHAITPGVTVYELQRSSDITYRLYDYDRVDAKTGQKRELHIQDSLNNVLIPDDEGVIVKNAKDLIFSSNFFSLYKLEVNGNDIFWKCPENTDWLQITIIKGSGKINSIEFFMGESAIVCDGLDKLSFDGNMEVLISWQKK